MDPTQDDWEPAIAVDPHGTYAYLLTTRYSEPKACGNCPKHPDLAAIGPATAAQTWGAPSRICTCPGTAAQNDPEIEVAADGSVYAVWMDDYNPGVVFARSTDHGVTWSAPLAVKAKSMKLHRQADPGHLARAVRTSTSTSTAPTTTSWRPTTSAPRSRAPVKTNGTDGRYYFAGGGAVLPNGTIVFTESSFTQTSTGPCSCTSSAPPTAARRGPRRRSRPRHSSRPVWRRVPGRLLRHDSGSSPPTPPASWC